ncbi:MAG TPA: hypothetical protein VH107_03815 [Lacipirellulaceae bacterium]|jgi:hypothetical protein|nr:hypothetical protein [Lacipirellulaceae bacterium]
MATTIVTTSNPQARTRLVQAMRATFTLAIVAAACSISFGFGRFWREWRSISRVKESPQESAKFESLLAVPSLAGRWSFADLEWTLKSQDVGLNELNGQLDVAANSASAVAGPPDMSKKFDQLVHELHIQPVRHGDNRVYVLEKPDLKAQLVLRDRADHTDLVALHAAFQKSADQWQLFELAPHANSDSTAETSHLLPLPAAAHRKAGRFGDDGHLLLEFAGLQSDADTLLALWKQNGWEVRPSKFSQPGGFDYLCARGEEVIYARSADPPTAIQNLMLVRTPTDAQQIEAKPTY